MESQNPEQPMKNESVDPETANPEQSPMTIHPSPSAHCLVGCNQQLDPCCKSQVQPDDPEYLKPPKLTPDCKGPHRPVQTFEEVTRKRAYIKDVLVDESATTESVTENLQAKESKFFEKHPETTPSLEFLKDHKEFQIPGRNPMRVPHDDLIKAMDGFTNMQLAHEICVNHDFRLEPLKPVENSLEERVRTQMKKAYWDIFDESLSEKRPNAQHAMSVFREMKNMLLGLLLPHNKGMRLKIESFLNENAMSYEIKHNILDFSKYADFLISVLGQLCCPMRDRQILDLKKLQKPSEVFKEVMHLMEQMQLDMANFLISQIRPTIMTNCVTYERRKFATFIEMEYRLHEDALRVTRAWLLRHKIADRTPSIVTGRAFAEVLLWQEKDWPETLTLDWMRFVALAEETRRASFLGTAVLSAFNAARPLFEEGDEKLDPLERANHIFLRCYPLREVLRKGLNGVIQKDDCVSEEKLANVMDLLAEQAVKVIEDYCKKEDMRAVTDKEKDLIRGSVRDCAREDNPVRNVLIRRMQDYTTEVVAAGKLGSAEFPKGLLCVEEQVLSIVIELHRIVMHNRAVFQDLYNSIIDGELPRPVFMNENYSKCDPNIIKVMKLLNAEPDMQLVLTQPARNEKLDSILDDHGAVVDELEDGPVVETTPEIETIIDQIIEESNIQDDFDPYANMSEQEAVRLLRQLKRHDPSNIKRQMKLEEESKKRVQAKKKKIREELRIQLKADFGLPAFDKFSSRSPALKRYCKLLKVYANETAEKQSEVEKRKLGLHSVLDSRTKHSQKSKTKHAHFDTTDSKE